MARTMAEQPELRAMAHELVSTALRRGSRDNCTALVARYQPERYSM
jgi:serine/threonine protein phosphatase PrpC